MSRRNTVIGGIVHPLALSPVAWWDFGDPATLALSGSNITQISDKSGSGYDLTQGSSGLQPTRVLAAYNGLSCGRFDGSDDRLTRASTNLLRNVTGGTVIAAVKYNALPATSDVFSVSTPTAATVRARLFASGTSCAASGRTLDADTGMAATAAVSPGTAGPVILSGVFDYANTDLFTHLDGALVASNLSFQSATTTSNTAADNTNLGTGVNGSVPCACDILEVFVFHAALSDTSRQRLRNYLRNKWAI